MHERAAGICATLIRARWMSREELPELETDPELHDEVSQRLSAVGLVLLERPGIPFVAVAVANAFRDADTLRDQGITSRTLSLLLYLWLQLTARFIYANEPAPGELASVTVSTDALLHELPGKWSSDGLGQELAKLKRLGFVQSVHAEHRWYAGPMLWLAVDHDQLIQFLRKEKGLPQAVARYLSEQGLATERPVSQPAEV